MLEEIIEDARIGMEKSLNALEVAFKRIRTGRASPSLLDDIKIDHYGTLTPLPQLANISIEDAKTIAINPWEKTIVQEIEKAIMESDIGINPQTEGTVIRLNIPSIDEERRKDLSKLASKYAEENKVSIRNIRRDIIDKLKKNQKDGTINEDELKKSMDEIQKITDKYVNDIDKLLKTKQEEIMKF